MTATMTKTDAKVEAARANLQAAIDAVAAAESALYAARAARLQAETALHHYSEVAKTARAVEAGEAATSGIDWSQAKSSYSGRAGACCCGCAGNHSDHRVAVKKQINRIKMLAGKGVELDIQPSYVSAENDGRLYIVYFN